MNGTPLAVQVDMPEDEAEAGPSNIAAKTVPEVTQNSKPGPTPALAKRSKPDQAPALAKKSKPDPAIVPAPSPVRSMSAIRKYKESPTGRCKLFYLPSGAWRS